MQNLYRLKIWGMINRNRSFLFIFIIILSFIIIEKCPKYVEVYKYTLNANVSILNDDLKEKVLLASEFEIFEIMQIRNFLQTCCEHLKLHLN